MAEIERLLRDNLIVEYFEQGLKYQEIAYVLNHQDNLSISVRQIKRILRNMFLGRRAYSDIDTVIEFIDNELKTSGSLHGYRMMWARCQNYGLNVRMNDIRLILQQLDPVGVVLRTARRFRRRNYYAVGPNFIWHLDGYDKLKPFGLCINGCICGFSRKIIWLNVYHTNSNPKVIGGYFLDAVNSVGGCPRYVRGDFGTENGLVRDIQFFFRRHDPVVDGRQPYIDGASTANQRIESWWGYLRREHMQFWIELFKEMRENGDFSGSFLDKNLILFCFLALIQNELDVAVKMWGIHYIRPTRNIHVPNGRPNVMYLNPCLWNTEDQLCPVTDEDVAVCKQEVECRSVIPCDQDIYNLCIDIMKEDNLIPAIAAQEAVDLYLHLRQKILALIN